MSSLRLRSSPWLRQTCFAWLDRGSKRQRQSPSSARYLSQVDYSPPPWATHLDIPKHGRIVLGHFPTPVSPWSCHALSDLDVQWSIKRDDLTGFELCGNKVRKLEFLLAEAVANGCDCVVTIGGTQSNHCRATAAAARMVGLEPHLVLLVGDRHADRDPGMEGNLLLDRMLGAKLHLVAASDYFRYGGDLAAMDKLNAVVVEELQRQGRRPYTVPVGGTTPLGSWGYIEAVRELTDQLGMVNPSDPCPFDHIVVAAGSGGTAAGLAIGCRLSGIKAHFHAVNVQHTPDAYYKEIAMEASALGALRPDDDVSTWLSIHDGGKDGYAVATAQQLAFIRDVGLSGVILDHVYTGKALFYFCEHARANPQTFRGKRILFWHTGGMFGLYAKQKELADLMPHDQIERMRPP